MNKAFLREPEPADPSCPEPTGCGGPGVPVSAATVSAQVGPELAGKLGDEALYCPTPGCPVGYFNSWGTKVDASLLRERIFPKHPDAPICACFGIPVETIRDDARAGCKDRIREYLVQCESPQARCRERSPAGQSCATEMRRLFMSCLSKALLCLSLLLPACGSTPPVTEKAETPAPDAETPTADAARQVSVRHWGGMREVMRDGSTEGRVSLQEVVTPDTVAVGALAGLAAEVTIVGDTTYLIEVVDPAAPDGVRQRPPTSADQATLLLLAEVPSWVGQRLPEITDLAQLEAAIQAAAAAQGLDPKGPFPFLVDCRATWLRMHVLNHSCPTANPDGPAPWRYTGEDDAATLVGFVAEGQAGVLTHHGQKSHVHAVLAGANLSGHLDEVSLAAGARLFLPGS